MTMFKKFKKWQKKKIMIGVGIALILTGFIVMSVSNLWYAHILGSSFIGGGIGGLIGPLIQKKE